MDAAI